MIKSPINPVFNGYFLKNSDHIFPSLFQSVLVAPVGYVLWREFFSFPLSFLSCIVMFGLVFAAYQSIPTIVGRLLPLTWENRFFVFLMGGILVSVSVLAYLIVAKTAFGAHPDISIGSFVQYAVTLSLLGASMTWIMGQIT